MLVLTRKENEKILIGNDIVITIVRTGDRVRLGIEAPSTMTVLRAELAEKDAKTQTETQENVCSLDQLKKAG
ncbi:hypothetical protein FACS189419_09160 [Planctomycetales bacterium]|nr:hypothetical protein FACS189419_09160 [Planctomycetales bacterium]